MSGHTNLKETVLEISGVNPRKCMKCGVLPPPPRR